MGYGIAPPVPPYGHSEPHFRAFQLIPHLGNLILFRFYDFIIDFWLNPFLRTRKQLIMEFQLSPLFIDHFQGWYWSDFGSLLWYYDVSGHNVMYSYNSNSFAITPHQWNPWRSLLIQTKSVTMQNHLMIVMTFRISTGRTALLLVLLATGDGTPSALKYGTPWPVCSTSCYCCESELKTPS